MKNIEEWEVLTPTGWKDFSGVVQFEKPVVTVTFKNDKELTGALEHRVSTPDGKMIKLVELKTGDVVEGIDGPLTVLYVSEIKKEQPVYDLVEVQSNGHKYFTNDVISHNCDEIAFIPPRIQEEFMAGTAPSLSATKGKMLITSTPNGNRDLFAKLWFGSGMEWNKKEHSYVRSGKQKNLFTPLFIPYWIDETKNNDEWINREKKTLDSPTKWRVEFECMSGDTNVDVYDEITDEYKILSLQEINRILTKDMVDSQFIIEPQAEN